MTVSLASAVISLKLEEVSLRFLEQLPSVCVPSSVASVDLLAYQGKERMNLLCNLSCPRHFYRPASRI